MNAQAAPVLDPLADFAKGELAARAASAPPPGGVQGPGAVPPPSAPGSEVPDVRDPQADALDAGALMRLGANAVLLVTTRNRRADPARAERLKQRRESAAKKCTRVSERVGMRLGRWIGDYLLAVGLVCEFANEFLEDALDERELELRAPEEKQQELAFGTPPPGAPS